MLRETVVSSGEVGSRWEGIVRVLGPVVVPAGSTLTVARGTKAIFRGGERGLPGIEVRGVLRVDGLPGKEVLFFPEGEWSGVRFVKRAQGVLSYARFEGLDGDLLTIDEEASASLADCSFYRGGNAIHCCGRATVVLRRCSVREQRFVGILAEAGAQVSLEDCLLQHNATGVAAKGLARASLGACRVFDSAQCGVNAMEASVFSVVGSHMERNHTAISASADAKADVRTCRIWHNRIGVYGTGASEINLFSNNFLANEAMDVDLQEKAAIHGQDICDFGAIQ